ncbi:unnamed protein product [Nyctereutes procyonoides]|uniref:(raccoon dog) hypothetical protein n=1 Tax=Nyctereutes procyonoides TaxID=34880 RepID=A0A811ZIF9_NYCPR|nr:unnamed protein product [Nyctereutes procyonoides]
MSEDNTEGLVSVGCGAPGPRQWALCRGGCCPTSPSSGSQILNYLCPPTPVLCLFGVSVYRVGAMSVSLFLRKLSEIQEPQDVQGEPSPRVSSPDCGTSLTLLGFSVLVANFSCPQRVPEEERVDAPDQSAASRAVARSPSAVSPWVPHRWMCRLGSKRQSHSSILDLTRSRAPGVGEGGNHGPRGGGGLPGRGASQMQTLSYTARVSPATRKHLQKIRILLLCSLYRTPSHQRLSGHCSGVRRVRRLPDSPHPHPLGKSKCREMSLSWTWGSAGETDGSLLKGWTNITRQSRHGGGGGGQRDPIMFLP